VQQRLSKLDPPMVAYLMRPARLPCWWGITVGYDLAQPQALTQRNRAREAGYKDAYVTASIPEAAARAACGDAWKDP